MSDVVIKVENLSKQYRLGTVGTGTISHDLNRLWAKIRGKDDPYLKVGQKNDRTKKGESEYVWALRDINFEVKSGEVLGIIGRNGAGKSTLLKILSQITRPTTGSVKMKGRIGSLLEVGTGFHPDLTGRENIYTNGAILGMRKWEIDKRLEQIIDFAGVERYVDTPVKRYSSGMIVRLGFAVAAHLEPEILIFDEVLAVGDADFQKKCLGKMQDVSKKDGRTVLFVSHNMGAIEKLCTSGLLLKRGETSVCRKLADIIAEYNFDSTGSIDAFQPSIEFSSPYFKPLEFFLTNDKGDTCNSFTNNQDIFLNVKGLITQLDPGLQIGFSLYDQFGTLICWSFSTDNDQKYWPKLESGNVCLKVKLPQRFLNEGHYSIDLGVAFYCREWVYEPGFNSPKISFSIKGGLSDSIYWTEKRPGILAPIFFWERV